MRNTVINELTRIAETDPRILMLTADLGFSVLEDFEKKFPNRYYNVGICENFMTSMAAGLAMSGFIPVTYSIGNFNTVRCMEQIRNDICYHNGHVIIISVGGGFSYGQLGITHHSTEDISAMREIPNLNIFVPADPEEAIQCLHKALEMDGPSYIRLARSKEPILYSKKEQADINKVQAVKYYNGSKVALLSTGPELVNVIKAHDLLLQRGLRVNVYSMPTIKPADESGIRQILNNSDLVVTCEEHQIAGGLGGLVAEITASMCRNNTKIIRLGLQDKFSSTVGSHDYLCQVYGLSDNAILNTVLKELQQS